MNTLFIIGNGFDLAHDLKTSYNHFINQFVNNRFKLIETNKLIGILASQKNNFSKWSDIEYLYFKLLNNFNNKNFFIENFGNTDYLYDSSSKLNKDFDEVKQELTKYLIEEEKNFKQLESYSYMFSFFNNENTVILNFNYTNIINKYIENYNSIRLINIHGELQNENNPIIFGYAASDIESKTLSEKNDNELMKNIKKFGYLQTGYDVELKNRLSLSKYSEIDVYILGHSCGISDRLILSEIFNHKKVKNINIIYYDNWGGYLQTAINIDRIIDDYSKEKHEPKSFPKLIGFVESAKMFQHNSIDLEKDCFKSLMRASSNYQSKKKPISGVVSQ